MKRLVRGTHAVIEGQAISLEAGLTDEEVMERLELLDLEEVYEHLSNPLCWSDDDDDFPEAEGPDDSMTWQVEDGLEKKNVPQLRKYAKDHRVDLSNVPNKKAEIMKAIRSAADE